MGAFAIKKGLSLQSINQIETKRVCLFFNQSVKKRVCLFVYKRPCSVVCILRHKRVGPDGRLKWLGPGHLLTSGPPVSRPRVQRSDFMPLKSFPFKLPRPGKKRDVYSIADRHKY